MSMAGRSCPQQALQDRILKEIIDRIPPREVFRSVCEKTPYRYRYIYRTWLRICHLSTTIGVKRRVGCVGNLLDANQRAAHSEFYTLGGLAITPDNTSSWRWRKHFIWSRRQ